MLRAGPCVAHTVVERRIVAPMSATLIVLTFCMIAARRLLLTLPAFALAWIGVLRE